MVFKNLCILVLLTKVAVALKGLKESPSIEKIYIITSLLEHAIRTYQFFQCFFHRNSSFTKNMHVYQTAVACGVRL